MVVNMPYGKVEINTIEEAKKFIKGACRPCDRGNLANPCSGAMSYRCTCTKYNVAARFGLWERK